MGGCGGEGGVGERVSVCGVRPGLVGADADVGESRAGRAEAEQEKEQMALALEVAKVGGGVIKEVGSVTGGGG